MNIAAFTKSMLFSPRKLADGLLTSQDEIARSAGLGCDAIVRKDRLGSVKTQTRLHEMVEIWNSLSPRFGSDLAAFAWYRLTPLPGFAGMTCARLVGLGQADAVMDYLYAVDAGGFA